MNQLITSFHRHTCFLVLPFLFFTCSTGLFAQRIDLSDDFTRLLDQVKAQLVLPVETDYKDIQPLKNRWLNYDFSIRSRKEKMEIRYKILPYREEDRSFYAPHIKAMQAAIQVATNDQEYVISTLSLPEKTLQEDYHADWGKLFTFVPKAEFSDRKTCQMITIYRDGKGMIILFFLFDKPPMELDYRHLAVSFVGEMDL